jgi:hypothetical protein
MPLPLSDGAAITPQVLSFARAQAIVVKPQVIFEKLAAKTIEDQLSTKRLL